MYACARAHKVPKAFELEGKWLRALVSMRYVDNQVKRNNN